MGPEALAQVLRPLADLFDPADWPDLLQGLSTPDDAAVWRLDGERALVLSADFFPPVVDDPRAFGRIAAANALSDLYAMGARPLLGINLVGWPEGLDRGILATILRGGAETMLEAGAVVAGGHTTTDAEPRYGLAVVGEVHPQRVLTTGGAREGDVLVLTKPVGTGVVTTAAKRDTADTAHVDAAVASMARLNRQAAAVLGRVPEAVHAVTDVTGFGLVGHAHEMAEQSRLELRLDWSAVPLLPGAREHAIAGAVPGGGGRNRAYYERIATLADTLDDAARVLLFDPQTSGGLLAALDPRSAPTVVESLRRAGEPAATIGTAVAGPAGRVSVV